MPSTSRSGDVRAAGAVVVRKGRVLLVHRPTYDDWSFPKGKLDRGEAAPVAAVREVAEETGLRIRLGVPLARQSYPNGPRTKVVDYWVGRVVGDHDVSDYLVNSEIDEVVWVDLDKARRQLTYPRDRHTLREALLTGKATRAFVVVRHGQARSRKRWKGDDRERPLLVSGAAQARRAVPLLEAYAVTRGVTSSSSRCVDSVRPYAEHSGCSLQCTTKLSEEDATPASVRRMVKKLVRSGEDTLLCTHRPVLPDVYDALGLETEAQTTGELVVVHHRNGRVRSVERHLG
jgi:8-oxo-(d)GTP phosphatase